MAKLTFTINGWKKLMLALQSKRESNVVPYHEFQRRKALKCNRSVVK